MNVPLTGASVPPLLDDYQPRLLTAADVAALPSALPTGDVRYELHHGRLIVMTPPGDVHGSTQLKVGVALFQQGELSGHGQARTETGVLLRRNPDHLLTPDVMFGGKDRLPLALSPEGYWLTIPHLVVEVRSKNDTLAALGRKAQDYLDAGVVVVWVIDPIHRIVQEHRQSAAAAVTIDEAGTLTLPDIIPGFSLPVVAALPG